MARKKHYAKTKHSRRRKISGIGAGTSGILVKVGGAVLGNLVSNQVAKMYTGAGSDYVAAAAPIAGGILTSMLLKGATGKGLAEGMYIAGGIKLASKVSGGALGALMDDNSYNRNFVALAPSFQNPRGVVAGITTDRKMDLKRAALLS